MNTTSQFSIDLNLHGRRALVCGASAGIGRAVALGLQAQGAEVIALARRHDRLVQLRDEGKKLHPEAPEIRPCVADLDNREQLEPILDGLLKEYGAMHIVVHNTGGPGAGPLREASLHAMELGFARHLLTAQLFAQKLVPGMVDAGYGRWINIVSTSVREPIPNLGVSNTIRGAMASWAKSMANELPPGVTINNVLPGFTDTERLDALRTASAARLGKDEATVQEMWVSQVPEKRLGRPEEIAAAVTFLASPAAAFIRGVSLPVDGGRLRSI